MVGSVTRNARPISAGVRPHSVRSVSATRAGIGSAGWQHVKISRSRSSAMSSSSTGATSSLVVGRRQGRASRSRWYDVASGRGPGCARPWSARPAASRARRRAPRRRPPRRTPPAAHSSARSQSPHQAIRPATSRPQLSLEAEGDRVVGPGHEGSGPERAQLEHAAVGHRVPGRDLDGVVEVGALEQVEARRPAPWSRRTARPSSPPRRRRDER